MNVTLRPSHWGIVVSDINTDSSPEERDISLATYFTEIGRSPEIFRGVGADLWGLFRFDGDFCVGRLTFQKKYIESWRNAIKEEISYNATANPNGTKEFVGEWRYKNLIGSFSLIPNENFKIIDLENLRDNKINQEAIFNSLAREELIVLSKKVSSHIRENPYSMGIPFKILK